jgi:hypothetical protein
MFINALNVGSVTMAELLSFYNTHSGLAAVKRFSDRRNAEKRVRALLAERQFNVPLPLPEVSEQDKSNIHHYGVSHCPSCNIGLDNGVGHDGQDANGKKIHHKQFEYMCLACESEFGPLVRRKTYSIVRNGKPVGVRPAMVESLKLDRRIESISSGIIYKNANQVFQAGLVSSSQGDRLSAVLYSAAKKGDRSLVITVNGKEFRLAA